MTDSPAPPVAPPCIFHREIEFVPAKRQFTGFTKTARGRFRLETLNPRTEPDANKDEMILEPEEVKEVEPDPWVNFGYKIMKIGAGLENLNNITCYLNSVLQCLTHTVPLAAFLTTERHKTSCRRAGFCAMCSIQDHVIRALQSNGKTLAPNDLVSNLRCISQKFQGKRKEDAHECLVNLLQSMHNCSFASGVPGESPSAYEKSLVHQIFGGRLHIEVECKKCKISWPESDHFLDLSLEIKKANSLERALGNFAANEYFDGGGREYQCKSCNHKVKAKKLSFEKAPNVLSIHLKRFVQDDPKIDKKICFGATLDLKPFVTDAYDGDFTYNLYGVLVHKGETILSGQNYCFIRPASGIWHSLVDAKVNPVKEDIVFSQKAYMLFYVRDFPKKPVSKSGDSVRPSPAVAPVDVAVGGALKEILTEGKSYKETAKEKVSASSLIQIVKAKENKSHPLAIKPSSDGIHGSYGSCIKDSIPKKDCDEKGSKRRSSDASSNQMELLDLKPTSFPTPQRSPAHKRKRMLKKKFSKSKFTFTRLSSDIILGAAFTIQNKIQKKVKRCALEINIQTQGKTGPSISEPTRALPIALDPCSSKTESLSTLKNDNGYDGNLEEGKIAEKRRKGVGQNGDTVSTKKLSKCTSTSPYTTTDSVGREGNIVRESGRDSQQNDIMNMLTKGLEETIVGRWDGIERPSSQIIGRSVGMPPVSIGYIGDDWDEEYDKGKRKKVRTSITEFGGPNLFQEVATKKAKFKKAKLDRSSFTNQPFRR